MNEYITLDTAIAWNNTEEKLMYICELTGLNVDNPKVDRLENKLVDLLESNNIEIK